MVTEGIRERRTCSCPRESFLADDQGLDIGVETSWTVHVLEVDKLVLEIGTKEHEEGSCLVYSSMEWFEKMWVRFLLEKRVDWRGLSAGRGGKGVGYLLYRR